jgi:hypothetical protein
LSLLSTLQIVYCQLTGTLPTELGSLTGLAFLQFYSTLLSGPIPLELGKLGGAISLFLEYSLLTGVVPTELNELTGLTDLGVDHNLLEGSLPIGSWDGLTTYLGDNNFFDGSISELFSQLKSLQQFEINSNDLTGTLPTFLYSLTSLEELVLGDNSFHGSLSKDIVALLSIVEIDLSSTFLSGQIPSNVGSLRKLELLDLADTHLSGSVPESLGKCVDLEVLYLYNSGITGSLPFDGNNHNITRLQYVSLDGNYLTGTLNSAFTNLPLLESFEISTNHFSGENVLSLGVGPRMFYLDASNNGFEGQLPRNWSKFVLLQYILLDYNSINGTIPNSIGLKTEIINFNSSNATLGTAVRSFIEFNLANNQLSGTIVSSLGTHVNMTLLSLASNSLTGTVCSELSFMRALATFNISNNNLRGNLLGMFGTESVVVFPNLTYVSIANNSFDMFIAPALFMSSLLKVISLSANCFSGDLPDTICYSSVLQSVVMNAASSGSGCKVQFPHLLSKIFKGTFSTNRLLASIPSCLWNIDSLQTLHMAGNGLTGQIPDLPVPASLINVQLGSNALTGTIPLYIQQSGQFTSLGLQHNKLTGTLVGDFAVNSSLQLDLSVNRLSGRVPRTFVAASSLNVLVGNVFQCVSNSDLPQNDQSSKNYVCGSSSYDTALYLWGVIMGINLLLCLSGLGYLYYVSNYGSKSRAAVPRSPASTLVGDKVPGRSVKTSFWAGWKEYVLRVFLNTLQWYQFKYPSGRDKFLNTFQFLTMMARASRGIRQIALVYIFVCMIIYLIMKYSIPSTSPGAIATVYSQYGWTTTSSYMHGAAPTVVVLIFLFGSLCLVAVRIRSKDWDHIVVLTRLTTESDIRSSDTVSSSALSSSPTTKTRGKYALFMHFAYKKIVIPALIQLFNVSITIAANVVYVEGIEILKLTPVQQILIEMCIASFKLIWGASYIPWTLQFLDELSVGHRLCHQVFMFCFLIIGAPLIASAIGSQDCFINVFVPYSPIQSSYTNSVFTQHCQESLNVVNFADGSVTTKLVSDCPFVETQGTVSENTVSPFIYSYQCGSTLLANYIPVLVYSYVFSSVVLPMIRIIMLHSPQSVIKSFLPTIVYRLLVANTLLDCDDVLFMLPTEFSGKDDGDVKNASSKSFSSVPRSSDSEDDRGSAASSASLSAVSPVRGSDASLFGNSIAVHSPVFGTRSTVPEISLMNGTTPELAADAAATEAGERNQDVQKPNSPRVELNKKSSVRLSSRFSNFTSRRSDVDDKTTPLFDGSSVVAKKLLDFAVMLSFGLAAPILGLVIAFSVVVNTGVWRIMIGKYLTYYATGNTIARDSLELSSDGLLIGAKSAMWVVTFVVIVFWCLMVYDMIADVYGVRVGSIVTACVFVLMPILLLAVLRMFDRYDVVPEPKPINSSMSRTHSMYFGAVERMKSARFSLRNVFVSNRQPEATVARAVSNPIVSARDTDVNSAFDAQL